MNENGRGRFRVGLDIGGTFTDLAVFDGDDRRLFQVKTLSSEDPVECVTAGLTKAAGYFELDLRGFLERVDRVFCFGSTHGLNTLLTRRGSNVGILTTKGHRDSYAIAQMDRQGIADVRKAAEETFEPLVPRASVREVNERIDYSGKTIIELDEAGVEAGVRELVEEEGIEALAIAFLWSHKKPAHEQRAAEIARELYPDLYVTASSDLSGALGEFTRLSTAVINAYIGNRVQTQASQLREFLEAEGLEVPILVMQMLGGVAPIEEIAKRPVALLKSGPVGGTVAGVAVLRDHDDVDNAVCIDMGGTSLDVSRITQGEMQQSRGFKILKHPITIPGVQIESVGAGGGSIATFEEAGGLGRLRVGPESAGSTPGPACYGRGGELPTVTDANLVLGILNPDIPLGGEIKLDRQRAVDAIAREVSDRVGQDPVQSAWGIYQVITAQMADAIEHFMVTNGVDVRQHALMAFGAATPQHALALATRLGTPKVIIPAASPVFSAYGLMMTDIRHAYEITDDSVKFAIHGSDVTVEAEQADHVKSHLAYASDRPLELLRRERIDLAERELSLSIDMRYAGQELELPIEIPATFTEQGTVEELAATVRAWQEKYAQVYGEGAVWSDGAIELIHYRAIAVGRLDTVPESNGNGNAAAVAIEPRGSREIYLGEPLQADVYVAEDLVPGAEIAGPAVVEGELTTVVLAPGDKLEADESGNYLATPGGSWQS